MALTVNQGWRSIRGHKSALIALIFWLVLIVAVRQYMQATDLTFGELSARLQTVLSESWYGPLLYILVYLARPLILFPASLLTILGGSVFGLWPGFLYVLIAGTVSAIIPYGIGRWLSSGQPPPTQSPTAAGQFVRMLRENPFVAVLTMRLIYLPYDADPFCWQAVYGFHSSRSWRPRRWAIWQAHSLLSASAHRLKEIWLQAKSA